MSVPQPGSLVYLDSSKGLPISWNTTSSVHERGRTHPPHQLHLWNLVLILTNRLQPGCQGLSAVQSLTSKQHELFTWEILGSAHDCTKPEGSKFLPWLELSFPGHPSSAFFSVTLPKRVELQGLSSPLCRASVTFPAVLFELLSSPMPAALLKEVIFCQHYTAYCERWAFYLLAGATPHSFPSKWALLSVQSPPSPCLESAHQLGWRQASTYHLWIKHISLLLSSFINVY